MSFLDERDDRPTESAPAEGSASDSSTSRRRRPPGRQPPGGGGGRRRRPYGPGTDQRTLNRRRGVAIVAAAIATVAVILLVRGCLNAREERSFESFSQEVTSLVSESSQESEALFELLDDPGDQGAVDIQNSLNGLSVDAQRLVERAQATDPPSELQPVQENLLLTLELRRESLEGIARELPTALGDEQQEEAIDAIAEDMRGFLASDVVYAERTAPNLNEALEAQELEVAVEDLPNSEFLPDLEWLDPPTVREAIDGIDTGSGG